MDELLQFLADELEGLPMQPTYHIKDGLVVFWLPPQGPEFDAAMNEKGYLTLSLFPGTTITFEIDPEKADLVAKLLKLIGLEETPVRRPGPDGSATDENGNIIWQF